MDLTMKISGAMLCRAHAVDPLLLLLFDQKHMYHN